jgi:hypothetical protein
LSPFPLATSRLLFQSGSPEVREFCSFFSKKTDDNSSDSKKKGKKRMKKFLVYGGTLDPTHKGHVETAKHVMHEKSADGVIYVPAGIPPHKKHKKITPA